MRGRKLGLDGFVTHFMVSGPQEEPYFNEAKDKNQLRYEAYLRSVIAEHKPVGETGEILVGAKSRLNEEWKYYYDSGSCFVNISTFYSVCAAFILILRLCLRHHRISMLRQLFFLNWLINWLL